MCTSWESRGRPEGGEWKRKQAGRLPSPPPAAARPWRSSPSPSLPAPLGTPPRGGPCSGGRPLSSAASYERRRRDGVTGNHFQKGWFTSLFPRQRQCSTPQSLFEFGELLRRQRLLKYLFMGEDRKKKRNKIPLASMRKRRAALAFLSSLSIDWSPARYTPTICLRRIKIHGAGFQSYLGT